MTGTLDGTMSATREPNVTSLRWLLSFFFGGVGSLLPYLSLHCRAVGLSQQDAYVLSIACPLLAAIGPLVAGPLVDRFYRKKKNPENVVLESNSCIRFTLAATILLAAIFYCLLLTVPVVPQSDADQPPISFACDERGAFLVQEGCGPECQQHRAPLTGAVRLSDCYFKCEGPTLPREYLAEADVSLETEVPTSPETPTSSAAATEEDYPEPEARPSIGVMETDLDSFFDKGETGLDHFDEEIPKWEGSGEDDSGEWTRRERRHASMKEEGHLWPHICFGDPSKRMCSVYTADSASVRIQVSIKKGHRQIKHCYYPLGGYFSCRIPAQLSSTPEKCKVSCKLEDGYLDGKSLIPSQCQGQDPRVFTSFVLYLVFRGLGDLFTSISISLLIGACLTASRLRIGREFVLPAVTYALMTSLMGYLHSPGLGPKLDLPPYLLSLAGFAGFSILSVLILLFATDMPIGPPDWWTSSKTVRFRHRSELIGLLFVLTMLGLLWGPYFSHVPWHISGTSDVQAYIGTSAALGALLSVPLVWKADVIVDFCGYSNILIAGFTFYILRYTGLLLIASPWVLFITGCLEVFTLCLVFFSAILYIRYLVPKHLTFTAQSLGFVAHFCIGNGIGCLISYLVSPSNLPPPAPQAHNVTLTDQLLSNEEFNQPHYLLYCGGAILSAVIAAVYFLMYHCCLKKRCLAPHYRKPPESQPAAVLQGPERNGTYTPLLVFSNGRPKHAATPD